MSMNNYDNNELLVTSGIDAGPGCLKKLSEYLNSCVYIYYQSISMYTHCVSIMLMVYDY